MTGRNKRAHPGDTSEADPGTPAKKGRGRPRKLTKNQPGQPKTTTPALPEIIEIDDEEPSAPKVIRPLSKEALALLEKVREGASRMPPWVCSDYYGHAKNKAPAEKYPETPEGSAALDVDESPPLDNGKPEDRRITASQASIYQQHLSSPDVVQSPPVLATTLRTETTAVETVLPYTAATKTKRTKRNQLGADGIVPFTAVELGQDLTLAMILNNFVETKKVEIGTQTDSRELGYDCIKEIVSQSREEKPVEGNVHPRVLCDLCDDLIIGTRFKCIICVDYDLCQKCESTGEHKRHAMLRIVDPKKTIVPWGKRLRKRAGSRRKAKKE